jgi:predicted unusual protein kinase regulating ubiquinone biosynthesis (AarF/ABC1/UbiB family)
LTTELIEGIPLIEIVQAVRASNTAYLDDCACAAMTEQIVRHLDWNMLNQVYIFGCFHADLHPANLFVLPGNAIGYDDFGMVGRLSEDVRESLIRYTWLLFHWEVESAVRELMHWFAPTSETNSAAARLQLVRIHEGFLYAIGSGADNGYAPAPMSHGAGINPYTSVASTSWTSCASTA